MSLYFEDNDKSTVTLSASPNPVVEGKSVVITATLSEALLGDVTVPLTIDAGTTETGDYDTPTSSEITITGGATSGTLEIQTNEDIVEDREDETFTVGLGTLPSGLGAGSSSSVTVTITDDDKSTVELSALPNPVVEGAAVTITATLSGALTGAVTVPLTIDAGTTETGDFTAPTSSEITITGGATSGTLDIQTNEDAAEDRENETFTVGLGTLPSTLGAGSSSSVEITITDDDKPELVVKPLVTNPFPEGGTAKFTVKLSAKPSEDVTVYVTESPHNIVPLTLDKTELTFTTTDWNTTQEVTVTHEDDEKITGDDRLAIGLAPHGGGVIGYETVILHFEDDDKWKVELSASPNPVVEGSEVTITATLSEALSGDVTVPLTIDAGTTETGDYTPPTSSAITITGGATSGTLEIRTNDDSDDEDETFTVGLGTLPSTLAAGTSSSVPITITDDDKPTVTLTASPNPVFEGAVVTILATLSGVLSGDVTIPLTIDAGTTETGDYTAPSLSEITITGNATNGALNIKTNDDSDDEDETFTVGLGTLPSTLVAGSSSSVPITITDDDKPTVELSASPNPVVEGSAVTITATLSGAVSGDVTVPLTIDAGTTETGDYTAPTSSEITITGGATSGTLEIRTNDDSDDEDETFTVGLGTLPSTLVAGTSSSVPIMITDDDKPTVELVASPNPVIEGSVVTITATLSRALSGDVTVPLTIDAGTTETGDYDTPTSSEITITGGATSGTLEIRTNDDSDDEDETFTVGLGTLPSTLVAGTSSSVPIMITDDDKPTVALSASPNPVVEGSAVTITATLSGALSGDVTVPLTIDAGTTETGDYTTPTSSEIAITGGSTSGTLEIQTHEDAVEDREDETFTVGLGTLPSTLAAGSSSSVPITITDDDKLTVALSASPNPVAEGSAVTITATLSGALSGDVTVPLTIDAGTTETGDYTAPTSNSITISGGATNGMLEIQTHEDAMEDGEDETFTVGLGTLPSTLAAGSSSSVPITITDDDKPTVALSASPNPVAEGSAVTITATLSGALLGDVTVPLTIDAGTTETGDYTAPTSNSITITGGATTGTLEIQTNEDATDDKEDETFTVGLGTLPSTLVVGDPSSVEIMIKDDDKPTVTLSASPNPVVEGSAVTITATLSEALSGDVTVPLTIDAGTTETGDYTAPTLNSITISGGATNGMLEIQTHEDDSEYDDETFTVTIDEGGLPSIVLAVEPKAVTVTIDDNDTATIPTVTLTASLNPVAEGEAVTITATLSEALSGAVTVPLTINVGTTEADDYTAPTSSEITISAGATSGMLAIQTHEDDSEYDDETFTVAIDEGGLPSTVLAVEPKAVTVTIEDDDTPPRAVTLSASPNPVAEREAVTIMATLSEALSGDVTVPLTITAGTTETGDYTAPTSSEITITGGATSGTLAIQTNEDAVEDREDETFAVGLATLPSTLVEGASSLVEITITDDDKPTVTLVASPNPVDEESAVTITATLSGVLSGDVTVPLTIDAGTTETGDYTAPNSSEITITGGATSGTLEIQTNEDGTEDKEDETFTVGLGTLPSTLVVGDPSSVEIIITDDDKPTVTLSASPNPVAEGSAVMITVTLSEALSGDVTVPLTIDAGTTETGDYTTPTSSEITITGGETSGTLAIQTNEDDSEYDDETFAVALNEGGLPSTVLAVEPKAVTVTIEDNDTATIPTVTLSASPNPVAEGEAVTITATLSEALSSAVTVPLTIVAGTAEAGDYDTPSPSAITISGGATSEALAIQTNEDNSEYDDETFTVAIDEGGLPLTVLAVEPKAVTVTIDDDDTPPRTVTLSASPNPVAEGEAVTITATLSEALTGAVTVPLTITVGTAEADDYTPPDPSAITITGGATSGTLLIQTHEDDSEYADETFTVTIDEGGLPSTVLAGDPKVVTVTIEDDDTVPIPTVTLSASSLSVEEGGTLTITATLSEVLPNPVTIDLTNTHGTTEPEDYIPLERITILGGQLTGSGDLVTNNDDIAESDEIFTVALGDLPAGLLRGDPSSLEFTILDDGDIPPPAEVSLSVDPEEIDEGGAVTVVLQLSRTLTTDVVVPLGYPSGTAEDEDYTKLERVTILSGQTTGSGQITTVVDMDTDDETFTVALGSLPPELVAGRETSQTVTIRDIFPPEVHLSATPNPVDEGDAVTLTVELAEALLADVTIPLVLTGVTADAEDYRASSPSQVEIEAGETRGTYMISIFQDDIAEGAETFTVGFGALPDEVVAGDPSEVAVTITDDDAAGLDAPPSVSLAEGSTGSFDLSLRSEPLDAVTVTLTGYSGSDLTLTTPGSLVFGPGNWSQPQQVALSAAEDNDVSDDLVELALSATGGGYTGVTERVLVTIIDNDVPGIDAPALVTVAEGGSQTLEVALVTAPSGEVTVTVPAVMGDLLLSPTHLTFTSGSWNMPQTVTLTADEDDDFVDDREEIILAASGGGYAGVTRPVAVTIADNDAAEIVAVPEVTMEEGGTYPLVVRLSAQPSGLVEVAFTGHIGTQLTLERSLLTFTPTNWQIPQTVTLTAGEDDNDFTTDRVELMLTASGGGYDNVTHLTTVTITDNDERSRPLSLSIYDQRESEDAGTLRLQIELSQSTDQTVTVQYETTDVEAEAGVDYIASRGIVIFGPGATRGVIIIDTIDDTIVEEAERFEVTLSSPRNAVIARGTGTGTILDDDGGGATLRIDDALALEEEGEVRFRVLLSHPQTKMISAVYQTQDGTARAGEDYEASSGVVTFPPGTTEALIAVPLLLDGLDWREETFTVHLVSSKQAKITKSVGLATIRETTTLGEGILGAYAARFVRTSSSQVVEALGERFRSGADGAYCGAAERAEMAQLWYVASSWDPSLGELLAGCRMSARSAGGSLSMWGRGAFRRFTGQGVDALTLDGEVTTGMLGVDYRWAQGLLAGVLLAHSQGDGSFEVVQQSGSVTAGLTGIYPYVSYARAGWDVWLSAGAGRGQAAVLELEGDLVSRFGAMGVRGTLASAGAIGLNYHGDVLLTDAEIADHGVTAEVHRVRAGVEAHARISKQVRPYVEANVRRDGGSAETGLGLEFGGGVRVAYPAWRMRGEVHTRGLVMHTAEAFTEWGLSGMLQVGLESEGLMVRLRPSWGHGHGMRMYRQQTILDAVPLGANAHRTELELRYGIPWRKGTARPVVGVTRLAQGTMYRFGGELRPGERFTVSAFGVTHARAPGGVGLSVRGSLQY